LTRRSAATPLDLPGEPGRVEYEEAAMKIDELVIGFTSLKRDA
jgi:hypothetical protein